jgi:hypothetical protein
MSQPRRRLSLDGITDSDERGGDVVDSSSYEFYAAMLGDGCDDDGDEQYR